jgi:undecaprenyl-diphosphatase
VVIAGLLLREVIATDLRALPVIATTTLVFGLLLGYADWRGRGNAPEVTLTLTMALLIGLAQTLALIPGVSRSGITITAALLVGLARPEAARFALLLAIPTTAAATLLGTIELLRGTEGFDADPADAATAAGLAMLSAYLAIFWLMRFVRRASFMPFVYYRVVLGLVLFGWWASTL